MTIEVTLSIFNPIKMQTRQPTAVIVGNYETVLQYVLKNTKLGEGDKVTSIEMIER